MKFEKPIAEIHKFGLKDFISASSESPVVETTQAFFKPGTNYDVEVCEAYGNADNYYFEDCV
jgi:hypothetical protein